MGTAAARVAITRAAAALVVHLQNRHGALMFRQSEGYTEEPSPVCWPVGDLPVQDSDVLIGMLDVVSDRQPHGVPVWVSGPEYPVWEHSQLLIDVAPGRGAGYSLEASEGVRFLSLARVVAARHTGVRHADSVRVPPVRR